MITPLEALERIDWKDVSAKHDGDYILLELRIANEMQHMLARKAVTDAGFIVCTGALNARNHKLYAQFWVRDE